MDYEKLGYTVIKMKYGDVGKYNIKNNIFITDITPSLSAFQDAYVNTRGMGIMHTHGFYNISWIEKGGFYYNVDLKRVYVRDKTLIMFSPGELHSLTDIKQLSGISIDFTDEYFRCIDPKWSNYLKYDVIKDVPVLAISNPIEESNIKNIISSLRELCDKMDTSVQSEASIYSMLTLLLCAIANTNEHVSVKNGQPKQTTPQHELYLSYTEMIEKNFCKHHGVQYYAEELGIGVHTLNACCKSNAGMTPLAVINARIMQEAKRMLLFTTMRSSEISFALGFPEQAHFINFFKRFTKISPLKYRDKHNVNISNLLDDNHLK